jgi:cytochrome c biogenesis protein CcmG, thiol:disulfide interchange protein DsbE
VLTLSVKIKQLIILGFILSAFATSSAQDDSGNNSNRTAHNFKLENIEREIIELNDFIGTGPILLCFWSSCCKSAVAQVEAFSALYEKLSEDGFVMLAIATDDEKTVAKVKPYVKSRKFKFPVLYDTDGNVARTYYAFDVPFSVLIDKSGKLVYSHLGYMKGDEILLDEKIRNLLFK